MRVFPGLSWQNAGRESLAGVTLLAIAVPLNIGYAQIAGLPPTAGLYALILPGIAFAVLASTRQMVASPDAAAAALVASSLGGLAAAGSADYIQLALAQAIIGGVLFGLCALFKLGFLSNFLSEPILIGFVGGLALDILLSQAAKMLGVSIDSGAEFVVKLVQLVQGIGTLNIWSLAIAVPAVVLLVGGRRIARQVPWALVVLVLSTIAVVIAGLEKLGVAVLGPVDSGPPVLTWPILDWTTWLQLTPSAAALTLVAMAEGLLVARRYGQKRGYATNANRDLLAFGAANLAAGASGGFSVGSSTSRTAAMDQIGSRTQLPTIVAAVGTLLLVMFGTALLEQIPSPAIGAIVAVAVLPLLGISDLVRLWKQRPFEFLIGAVCFLGAILLGPIWGILIAFILSLINLARRAANPVVEVLTEPAADRGLSPSPVTGESFVAPGILVVRFTAPLFFANAAVFADRIGAAITEGKALGLRHLILDLEGVTDVDVTGGNALREALAVADTQAVSVHLSRARAEVISDLAELGITGLTTFPANRDAIDQLSRDSDADSPGMDEAPPAR